MAASKKDADLYGIPRPKKLKGNAISSSNSLAFTSQLSSLISNSSASQGARTTTGRYRPKKEDIFATHNKNTKKRARADLQDIDHEQKHSNSSEPLDDDTWRRARRNMEEKARLYAAMKRGDVEDDGDKYAVDFDRKWAEAEAEGKADVDTSEEEEDQGSDEELVEYVDEFGRTRQGTKAQWAREERRRKNAQYADEPDRFAARPKMPTNVIYGNAIQTNAFNPDEPIAAQMSELAAKRDKEPTPPPEEHFDGRKEIRTKGAGFFQFSGDAEERKRQMAELERERAETEKRREGTAKRKQARKAELEARKKEISQKRSRAQADRFLDSLMEELQGKLPASGESESSPK
jgi:hypothetical protein